MSEFILPIVKRSENSLLNLSGRTSYAYKVMPIDLTQKDFNSTANLYSDLGAVANSLSTDSNFSFYSILGETYIVSDGNIDSLFNVFNLVPEHNMLEKFFQAEQLYSPVEFCNNYLFYNNQYISCITLSDLPKSFGWECLNGLCDYGVFFKKQDSSIAKRRIKKIRNSHFENMFKMKKDHESAGALGEADAILENLTRGEFSEFEMVIVLFVRANDPSSLNNKIASVCNYLTLNDFKPHIEGNDLLKLNIRLSKLFSLTVPGQWPLGQKASHYVYTPHLVNFIPVGREFLHEKGMTFFLETGEPVFFDLLSTSFQNRNVCIVGESGSGKSVISNDIIFEYINDGYFIIFDDGYSYRRTVRYKTNQLPIENINPMLIRDPLFLKNFIVAFLDRDSLSKKDEGRLYQAIKDILISDIERDLSFFELLYVLDEKFDNVSSAVIPYERFVSSEEKEINRITYFELSNIPKELHLQFFMFASEIQYTFLKKGEVAFFIGDECASTFKESWNLVSESVTKCRKSGGITVLASQGANHFPPDVSNNSHIQFILPHLKVKDGFSAHYEKMDWDIIDSLKMKKNEKIGVSDFKDIFIRTKDKKVRKKVRHYLTPLKLELFHTEPNENGLDCFVEENLKYFEDYKSCVDAFVGMKYAALS